MIEVEQKKVDMMKSKGMIEVEIEQGDLDVLESLRRPALGEELGDVLTTMLNILDRRRVALSKQG